MASQPLQPDGKTRVAAVVAIASTYTYFLIFAQFGFLQAVRVALGKGEEMTRPLMTGMGIAGIMGSILAARGFKAAASRRWLTGGFAGCALGAVGALAAHSPAGFFGVAVVTGLGAGLTTVTLAGVLAPATGSRNLGVIVGFGTGLAYGFCNLPGVFGADARIQALIALAAAALGMASGSMLIPRFPAENLADESYSRAGIARWIVIFLALVCLDSALFYYLLNYNAHTGEELWDGSGRQWLNAGMHLAGAILAGWVLDRGRLRSVVSVAAGAIVGAAWWLTGNDTGVVAVGMVYMTGVSAYSTALVFYPARSGRPGLSALLYAVAGWGGSGLGIGLVAGRGPLSMTVIATLAAIMGAGLLAGYLTSHNERLMDEKI